MDPPTLILVRHAQALGQEFRAPLSAAGVARASELAAALSRQSFDVLVSSPMRRAFETSQAIGAASGMAVRIDGRLVERTLTAEPRPDWREVLRASFEDGERRFFGGETGEEARRRALQAISDLVRQGFTRPLLVTHGNLLALILQHFRPEIGFEDWERLGTPDAWTVRPVASGWAVEHAWNPGSP